MLKIGKTQEQGILTFVLTGELDSETSPDFEREIENLDGVAEVVLDLADLAYTSSAGLRVLVRLKRQLGSRSLQFKNVGPEVREVLDMTGLSDQFGL